MDICSAFDTLLPEQAGEECRRNTPRRAAEAWREMMSGYEEAFPDLSVFDATPGVTVKVEGVDVHSTCEHHLLPFFGKASVEYVTKKKAVGLSKIPRLVRHFSRRLQIQEKLTCEIATSLSSVVGSDVTVRIRCVHMCVRCRGVRDADSVTETTYTCREK